MSTNLRMLLSYDIPSFSYFRPPYCICVICTTTCIAWIFSGVNSSIIQRGRFTNRSTNRSIKLLTQNNARRHVYPHFCRGLLLAKNDDDIHEGGTGSNLRDHESRATRSTNVICQKCLQIIWVVVGAVSLLLSITTIYYYHYWGRIMCN